MDLFVGGHAHSIQGEPAQIDGLRCFSPVYPPPKHADPERMRVLLDSGVEFPRTNAENDTIRVYKTNGPVVREHPGPTTEGQASMDSQSTPRRCTVDGCDRKVVARGYCGKHYQRWSKYGDPNFVKLRKVFGSLENRLWSRVDKGGDDECWLWNAGADSSGYGTFHYQGKTVQAHRVAYAVAYGDIPDGLFVCHKCDVRRCCNPRHLFLGTNEDNIRDRDEKGRGIAGERVWNAKLTADEVRAIRRLRRDGWQQKRIAKKFDIAPNTVSIIVNYKTWKHIE